MCHALLGLGEGGSLRQACQPCLALSSACPEVYLLLKVNMEPVACMLWGSFQKPAPPAQRRGQHSGMACSC